MRITHLLGKAAVISLGATALTFTGLANPVQAKAPDGSAAACVRPDVHTDAAAARGGHDGLDHRGISAAEQRSIEAKTDRILDRMPKAKKKQTTAAASIPVYVHVMRDAAGNGDVTDTQINQQISVLNSSYGATEFSFSLAGVDRYNNSTWHRDRQSATYRSQTRQGGANALNIWLVDFEYLGIATFPWDYSSEGDIDGIRVQYSSLPGGSAARSTSGRRPPTRRATGSGSTTRSRAAVRRRTTRSPTRRRRPAPPAVARADATRARCPAWTRSTTTWTTATTLATPTSPVVRARG